MAKKPKPQSLRERIEKSSTTDSVDQGWQDYFNEAAKAFGSLSQIHAISLLDVESAKDAVKICSEHEAELSKIKKQLGAVTTMLKQKKSELEMLDDQSPWSEFDLDKKQDS